MNETIGLVIGMTISLVALYLIWNNEPAINASISAVATGSARGIGALQGR